MRSILSAPAYPARRLALALLACLLVSSGCSSSDEPDATGSENIDANTGSATSYPLTLKTPYGETTLEAKPERVAVVDYHSGDVLLALGITPVIVPDSEFGYQLEAGIADSENRVDISEGMPFEKIAQADPDLIVAYNSETIEQDYDTLAQIAPVLTSAEELVGDTAFSWRDSALDIAHAVGRSAVAEKQIEELDARFAGVRKEHPEYADLAATIAINYGSDYGISIFSYPGSSGAEILDEFGFKPNRATEDIDASTSSISPEKLELLDGDLLLMSQNGGTEEQEKLESSGLFKSLEVVKDKGYHELPPDENGIWPIAWVLAKPSLLGLQWGVDYLDEQIAEAVADRTS